jgi:hypothetical protein
MRCPVCRAENDRDPTCRRCKADLSLLVALEARRDRALAAAASAMAQGNGAAAETAARAAHDLRAGDDSARTLALAHLLQRHFAEALAWCRRARPSPEGAQ